MPSSKVTHLSAMLLLSAFLKLCFLDYTACLHLSSVRDVQHQSLNKGLQLVPWTDEQDAAAPPLSNVETEGVLRLLGDALSPRTKEALRPRLPQLVAWIRAHSVSPTEHMDAVAILNESAWPGVWSASGAKQTTPFAHSWWSATRDDVLFSDSGYLGWFKKEFFEDRGLHYFADWDELTFIQTVGQKKPTGSKQLSVGELEKPWLSFEFPLFSAGTGEKAKLTSAEQVLHQRWREERNETVRTLLESSLYKRVGVGWHVGTPLPTFVYRGIKAMAATLGGRTKNGPGAHANVRRGVSLWGPHYRMIIYEVTPEIDLERDDPWAARTPTDACVVRIAPEVGTLAPSDARAEVNFNKVLQNPMVAAGYLKVLPDKYKHQYGTGGNIVHRRSGNDLSDMTDIIPDVFF